MLCSSINLQVDMSLWFNPAVYDTLTRSYQNLSLGEPYDCGLTSVPCASNITKLLTFSNSSFVYWFDLITINVVLSVLGLLGIVGNVLNVMVVATKNIANDSTNTVFLCLSLSDLFCSLSCGVLVGICFLCFVDESLALTAFNTSFPYLLDTIKRFSLLSLDFVALISVQRAVAVVLPFKIKIVFTNKNVKAILTSLVVLFIVTQIPSRVGYYPRWVFHPYFNKVVSLGYSYRVDYRILFDYIGIYYYSRSAIDLAIIAITISITIIKLNVQGKQRMKMVGNANLKSTEITEKSTKMSAQEVKVIKMSTAVCVVTFIIYVFNMLNSALIQMYADNLYGTPVLPATTNGGILLAAFGSSFNFFLYLAMSSLYRERLGQMLGIRGK